MITLKGVITPVTTGVICDHAVITKYFYWGRYLVMFTEYFRKWPEIFPVSSIDAETIAKRLVNEIIPRHGAPRTLLSDRGKNFL